MIPVHGSPFTSDDAGQISNPWSFLDCAIGSAGTLIQRVLNAALSAIEKVGLCIGSVKPAKYRGSLLLHNGVSQEREAARWLFSQQFDDVCHAIPWLNLRILETFKANAYKIENLEVRTRREWFGKDFIHWQTWHTAIAACAKSVDTPVQTYLKRLVQNGPVMPHFYDKSGKSILSGPLGILQSFLMPHGIIDVEGLRNFEFKIAGITLTTGDELIPTLGLKVPIVRENGEYQIFDQRTQRFEKQDRPLWEVEMRACYNWEEPLVQLKELSEEDRRAYGLPSNYREIYLNLASDEQEKSLGFESIAFTGNIGSGLIIDGREYTCYLTSIYKLMLITMGVGPDNEELTRNSTEYQLHDSLKQAMQDPENPWREDLFSKEKFLEYHIAKLFKQNHALFEETKKEMNFLLSPWKLVEQLKANEVYRSDGTPYLWDEIKEFLPGEEQLAAYYLTLLVRSLWTGAINPAAFDKTIGIKIPFLWNLFQFTSAPLVNVWKKVLVELKKLDRESFVSFAGHGFVVDFSQTLQEMQNSQTGVNNPALLRELGFAGIESWLGSHFKDRVFYAKK